MSMPVQLQKQASEENGFVHMDGPDCPRGSESPVKQHKGIHLPSCKGAMDAFFGTVNLGSSQTKVVFLFAQESDSLLGRLRVRCEEAGFSCSWVATADATLETLSVDHLVVVVDVRWQESVDNDGFMKSLLIPPYDDVVSLVAVVTDLEAAIIPHLASVGYSRILAEAECERRLPLELQLMERNESKMKKKIQYSYALFEAVDHCTDAIEITTPESDGKIVYVNQSYEDQTGFNADKLIGYRLSEAFGSPESGSKEHHGGHRSSFRRGERAREGYVMTKQSNGDMFQQRAKFLPISNALQHVIHYVTIKESPEGLMSGQRHAVARMLNESPILGTVSASDLNTRRSLGSLSLRSMMHQETPMGRVFTMLAQAAQHEDCSLEIRTTLERVIGILGVPTELYSLPEDNMAEDSLEKDFVRGLIQNTRRPSLNPDQLQKRLGSKAAPLVAQPHRDPPVKFRDAMKNVMSWEFDIIRLEQLSGHQPLYYLGLEMFNHFKLVKFLGIDEKCLGHWLQVIEKHYRRSNTYHNSTHAADVLHCAAYFLHKMQERGDGMEQGDIAAVLIACAIHDIDHPGRTNPFLCNSNNDLAVLYNDTAVLESHHAALAFRLTLQHKKINIFKNLDTLQYRTMRSSIIDMVMATDMSKHFEHLQKFKTAIETSEVSTFSGLDADCKLIVKRTLVKTADISNQGRPQHLCVDWSKRISEEYFAQTDEEKKRGYPVMLPAFERSTCYLPKTQVQFIDFFILDLYQTWNKYLPIPAVMVNIAQNNEHWKKLVKTKEEAEGESQ